MQASLLCHDKVSTHDLYIPDRHFHRAAQDPVDIILSDSVYNFQAPDHPVDATLPLSRDIPSCRKEDATIVFLQRSNKPLVSSTVVLYLLLCVSHYVDKISGQCPMHLHACISTGMCG